MTTPRPVLLAATIPEPYMTGEVLLFANWLANADAHAASHPAGVRHLAVCEGGSREAFSRLSGLFKFHVDTPSDLWTVAFDDGRTVITTANRQRHLVVCQNLAADRAWETGCDLFMVGAGVRLPADVLPKLYEMREEFGDSILCGPYVPSYAQTGTPAGCLPYPGFFGLAAGAVLIPWEALDAGLRWRVSGISDDYRLMHDAQEMGMVSIIRTDCVAEKYPAVVIPVEDRPEHLRRL